jgi:nifR3 family TIM-barrel protein
MAGYSDVPYRAICRAFGSAMNYTEFVPVEALLGKKSNSRFWQRLDKKVDEYPVVFQVFGNNAQKILDAALRIEELEPDIIDINMGCSTRRVSARGAGAGMMPQPELVRETYALLSKNLSVPVTGKIRLGWDDNQRNYSEIAKIMEDNGAALVAMHSRTKVQNYGGRADWDEIARLRQIVNVPVVGNGDVRTPEDIDRLKEKTGCEAVMIGRAAIGNPWIFSRLNRSSIIEADIVAAVEYHLQEMVMYYGEKLGVVLFRKHLKHYLAEMVDAQEYLGQMLQATSQAELHRLLHQVAGPTQINLSTSL